MKGSLNAEINWCTHVTEKKLLYALQFAVENEVLTTLCDML